MPEKYFLLLSLLGLALMAAVAEAQIEAFAGEPFGVGRITLRLSENDFPQPLGAAGIELREASGRTFYPAIDTPPDTTMLRKILVESPLLQGGPVRREAAGIIQGILDQIPPTTIYFLFKGDRPLDIELGTRRPQRLTIRPLRNPVGLNRLVQDWWKQYTSRPQAFLGLKKSDYPPVIQSYLESMLSARLGLPLPPLGEKDPTQAMLEEQLGLMLGTEATQTAMIRDRMLGDLALSEATTLPLPVAKEWPSLEGLKAAKDVKIEPIAMRVPEECFYIRFGNYANFLWMQDTMARWGGDVSNLISLRGLDYETNQRMEEHLIVKQTTMGRMLGGTLISDVAMIGTDLFMREGASFGLLFEARNQFLLDRDFRAHRDERIKQGGVTEETITIDDKKVSFIHSENDTVRSFYLADNGYILITSSKEVMRRFIATGKKQPTGSLGVTEEFRHARTVMPTSREDTIFVYFSDAFFRNMASPHYWIEMRRRLQAVADIEVLTMARLAATGETSRLAVEPRSTRFTKASFLSDTNSSDGIRRLNKASVKLTQHETTSTFSVEKLKQLRLLPKNFGPRPDGSEVVADAKGRLADSLRGRRGCFVPIPDVPVEKITPAEAAAYHRFLSFYHEKWGRLDPMIVGLRREAIGKGEERITIDAQANPFAKKHYETLLRRTGPADPHHLAPVEGNIIDFQAVLPDQYIFVGLQDVQLPSLMGNRRSGNPMRSEKAAPARTISAKTVSYQDPRSNRGQRRSRLRGIFGGGEGLDGTVPAPLGLRGDPQASMPQQKVGLFDVFVGYIGTTGELGIMSLFQALVTPTERIPGQAPNSQDGLQLHQAHRGEFTLFSFQSWLLERVGPQLRFVEAERPAQLRLDVGDVARAKITPTLNRLSYVRTRTTSLGNLRLLQSLQQQLGVPPEEDLEVAETLLDAKLICPLGGKYQLQHAPDGRQRWTSTAIRPVGNVSPLEIPIPRDYVGPPLNWFRGLKLDVSILSDPRVLSAHAELIMKLP